MKESLEYLLVLGTSLVLIGCPIWLGIDIYLHNRPRHYFGLFFKKSGTCFCKKCSYYFPSKGLIGGFCDSPNNHTYRKDTEEIVMEWQRWSIRFINHKNNCPWFFEGDPKYKELQELLDGNPMSKHLSEYGRDT